MSAPSPLSARAAALLRDLSGPLGIHASRSGVANYRAVFTRDAVMAGIAGMLSTDDVVAGALARTLVRLRELQGAEGQIASNYRDTDGHVDVSFGTLAPRLDAASWYVIGVCLAGRARILDAAGFRDSVAAVFRLQNALEYNGRHLLYVPPGGNWADEYPYEGYVLSDQVLRAWALDLAAAEYGDAGWRAKAAAISEVVAARFAPGDGSSFPISAFSPTTRYDFFDLAACSLIAVSGVAPGLAAPALDAIAERYVDRRLLPPAFSPVIDESHELWPALRRYHAFEFRNRPHEYHNGGIWPIWLGWLSLALACTDRDEVRARLEQIATRALAGAFDFEEYLHGVTLAPGGVPGMAYSASGLIFMRCAAGDARTLLRP